MEPFGDQWNNTFLNGNFSNEDAEFMAQLLGNSSLSNESSSALSSAFWCADDSTTPTYPNDQIIQICPSFDNTNTNNIFSSCYYQDNSYSASEYYLNESTHQASSFSFGSTNNSNSSSMSSINFCFGKYENKEDLLIQGGGINKNQTQDQAQAQAQDFVALHAKNLQITSTEPNFPSAQFSDNDDQHYFMENSKKRPHISSDHVVLQNEKKRNVKPKKNLNVKVNNNNNNNNWKKSKTSSCGCSEGDDDIDYNNSFTNAASQSQSQSQSQSEDVSCSKGKGSRGSASDPQSLYARKRRERINERLKILQNLVPNGTKVDISTMLEEAVQYVKFLQLQIKLLSSDDHWMYAPIAYNGMDIGLDMNITTPMTATTFS